MTSENTAQVVDLDEARTAAQAPKKGKRGKTGWCGTWEGGRIWRDARGVKSYVITRRWGENKRAAVSTGCTDPEAARAELARWEKNPAGYVAQVIEPAAAPLYLDAERSAQYLAYSRDVAKNTIEWRRDQRRYLAWWAEKLIGLNLRAGQGARSVNLDQHILPALEGATCRDHRIRVLCAFYTWLREVRRVVAPFQDPTFGALKAGQSNPAQWMRSKAVPLPAYLAVLEDMRQHAGDQRKGGKYRRYADLLFILGGTGWHVTELRAWLLRGLIDQLPANETRSEGCAGILETPDTKAGGVHRTRVSRRVLQAALRVVERTATYKRKGFSRSKFDKAVREACERVHAKTPGVEPFNPGQMRASVATWAINNGSDWQAVAAFLHHKSERTTKRFYAVYVAPAKVATPV